MSSGPSAILPEELRLSVIEFGRRLEQPAMLQPVTDSVFSGMVLLPPENAVKAGSDILHAAGLYQWRGRPAVQDRQTRFAAIFSRFKRAEPDVVKTIRNIEYIFLFHGNGYLRQAALEKITGPLPASFIVAAIIMRLDDWVGEVRQAALDCAERTLPRTDSAILSGASLFLLQGLYSRVRWGAALPLLQSVFTRPEVAHDLFAIFLKTQRGSTARLLRISLQWPWIDEFLPVLARKAFLPSVRQIATQALISGKASWPAGFEREWIDKSLGISKRRTAFEHRKLSHNLEPETLAAQAARDRSALVRKIAADALIQNRPQLRNSDSIIAALKNDRNKTVRDRIEYVLKTR
jgi:hypothetical protein